MRDERGEGFFDQAGTWVDQRYSNLRDKRNKDFSHGGKIKGRQ